jgi:Flp pilus assembly protein CpaB
MNRSRFLLLGGISLAFGLVVSFYVYRDIQSVTGKAGSEPMINAMVAAKDLEVGARLQGPDIKVVRVPVSVLPPGSPRKTADVIGRGVILPIAKRTIYPFGAISRRECRQWSAVADPSRHAGCRGPS